MSEGAQQVVSGHWYAPEGSTRQFARLELGKGYRLLLESDVASARVVQLSGTSADLHCSDRTGRIPRRIGFPDGSVLETPDNDGVDAWLRDHGRCTASGLVLNRLESSWRWAVFGVLFALAIGLLFFHRGLSAMAGHAAHALPVSVAEPLFAQCRDASR